MLKYNEVEVKINNRNIKSLKSHKDDIKIGDSLIIPIELLMSGSHVLVECICDVCGKEKKIMYQKYVKNVKNGDYYSCSSKCSQEKVKKTSIKRFNKEYYSKTNKYKESVKNTNLEKWGSEYYLTSDIGKEKIKNINLNKWGVTNPFKSDEIKNRIRISNLEKWGVDNPSKSNQIKELISNSKKESWNNKFYEYYKNKHNLNIIKYNESIYHINCNQCKSIFEIDRLLLANRLLSKTEICTICNKINGNNSGYENQLYEFIRKIYDGEIIRNTKKIIHPYEIDIYLPDLKIAFEFNGIFWHSDRFKEKSYHFNKHKLCKDIGIELIQIWEDNWLYKNEIVRSIIKNKLKLSSNKIFARKCKIKLLNSKESRIFLLDNHLKGDSKSLVNIGLYYNDELVSLMAFGKTRLPLGNKENFDNWELYRFCNKKDYTIVGSASKILNYFIKNYNYNKIISYYDKSLGYNNFYEKIGFKYIGETPIDYYYIKSGIRIHRYNFNKSKLIKMGYSKEKTANEIIKEIGIDSIFGVGNYKYLISKF
jgi:hypothetical protein